MQSITLSLLLLVGLPSLPLVDELEELVIAIDMNSSAISLSSPVYVFSNCSSVISLGFSFSLFSGLRLLLALSGVCNRGVVDSIE
jgi:hypothetical protein